MSFRDNLLHLRATRNMTQEHLAMLVGVSRQSVAKWEAGRSNPEMDKLIKLCEIFDCTLDELVQGDLTARAPEPQFAIPAEALASDVVGYDEHQRRLAGRIALGVAAIIAGFACAAYLDGVASEGLQAAAFFGGLAVGLAFIIPAGIEHAAFTREHPYVADFYTAEQRLEESAVFGRQLALGIAVIFVGVVFGACSEGRVGENVSSGVLLACVAIGVFRIVYCSMLHARFDIEEYNISALEELSEEEISGIVGVDRAAEVLDKVHRNSRIGAACGVIMLLATAIALPLMFWATQMGDAFWTRFFWMPWMVGGLLCGIASIVLQKR